MRRKVSYSICGRYIKLNKNMRGKGKVYSKKYNQMTVAYTIVSTIVKLGGVAWSGIYGHPEKEEFYADHKTVDKTQKDHTKRVIYKTKTTYK